MQILTSSPADGRMGSGASKTASGRPKPHSAPSGTLASLQHIQHKPTPQSKPASTPQSGPLTAPALPRRPNSSVKGAFARSASRQIRLDLARNLSPDKESDQFHDICMRVFQNADRDGDRRLNRVEFIHVMRSPSLGLNLSDDEVWRMER